MSTDLHERANGPAPDPKEPEKPKPALSFAQVAGGALAAMTAAALGSRLSVAGTVVGAALASVVAAVAGSIYTASLRRTHDRVTAVWKGRGRPALAADDSTPRPDDEAGPPTRLDATPVSGTAPGTATSASPEHGTAPTGSGRPRIGWKPVLVGSLLMFAIAAVALTGIELATGQALSGGSGTTVGHVAEGRSAAPSTRPSEHARPSASPTAEPTPSTSAEPSTSARPSPTPTGGPTAEPTPSTTAEPSTSGSPTPDVTPSGSAPTPGSVSTS